MTSTPLFISVGGGKGGVGKSVIAANVATAISQLGFRTVLVDSDLGAANQHTLLGIDRPQRTLQDFLDKEVRGVEEIAEPTGCPRLFLIPGIGAVPGAANIPHAQKLKLLRHLRLLDAEAVVIDVGAGVSYNVIDFFELGDVRMLVTSPQLPALQNAYCFLKAAYYRGLKKSLRAHRMREVFSEIGSGRETETVRELRDRARALDPALGEVFERLSVSFGAVIVGNMLANPSEKKVIGALSKMAHDYLDVQTPVLATLAQSATVHASVNHRRPFVLSDPDHAISRALRKLAEELVVTDVHALRSARAYSEPPLAEEGESIGHYLRREPRATISLPVRVHSPSGPIEAEMVDVSGRGAMLAGPLGLRVGALLRFTTLETDAELDAVVRHVSLSGERFGVEFVNEASRGYASRWLQTSGSSAPQPALASGHV